jgi:hypothetical protein
MPCKATEAVVTTLGIDIGNNVFHLIGLNKRGAIVPRQKLSRGEAERPSGGNVVDLMEALKRSIGEGSAPGEERARREEASLASRSSGHEFRKNSARILHAASRKSWPFARQSHPFTERWMMRWLKMASRFCGPSVLVASAA